MKPSKLTCEFRTSYEPETEKPLGPACGVRATYVILWDDRRYSPACLGHGLTALDEDRKERALDSLLVESLRITDLEAKVLKLIAQGEDPHRTIFRGQPRITSQASQRLIRKGFLETPRYRSPQAGDITHTGHVALAIWYL